MSVTYKKSQRTSNNRKSCHHIYNELVLCCTLPSHDIVTFSRILLSHYCHMMYSHWTILIVTLLLHDIFTLCVSRLLYAVLTLCHTRLIDFCGINNFVILFAHKEIHKLTWISPNQRDNKQIDHLLISGKWRRSLQDVRFRRGADVGSDHHLVVAHIRLKLKRTVTPIRLLKWFDVSKLKDAGIRPVVQYYNRKRKHNDWLSGDMWTTTKYLISLHTNLDPSTV